MFGLSPAEMVIVGVVAIMLFGNKLPDVAKSLGKSFNEFKRGMSGIEDEFRDVSRKTTSYTPPRPSRAVEDREESSGPRFEPPPAEGAA